MVVKKRAFEIVKYAFLVATTVTVTALMLFMGAPMLRALRNHYGPVIYWLSGVLVSAAIILAMPTVGMFVLILFSLWVTVGCYQELEERGHASFWTAALGVAAGSLIILEGSHLWANSLGLDLASEFKSNLEIIAQQLSTSGKKLSDYGISAESIIGQVPSMVVGLEMTCLAFALMFGRRTAVLMGLRFERVAGEMRLLEFRVPDFLIWIAMFSFLLSFISVKPAWISTVSTNVFSVTMGFYFFQGLAVLEAAFLAFKVGNVTRFLTYLLVVGQLLFLLSVVGVIDYWVDFRRRIKRWRSSEKNRRSEENI